jgi:hypothetical protein
MEGQDRRRSPRSDLRVLVEYAVIGYGPTKSFSTGIRNISKVGVCLVVFQSLEMGQMIALTFSLPELDKSITVEGKVVRINQFKSADMQAMEAVYEVGAEFMQASAEDIEFIEKYVQGHSGGS